ncbi:MAG: phosphotransferase [Alphaproteobacteria bacterium]|nr:phosphotransferase [Alphaproteobacteria bacterium]
MTDNNLSFEEIVSSISDNEMMALYQYKSSSELNEDNLQRISPEKQRFYLAFYAKAAYEHVGFEGFSPENKEKFKAQIEQIYANITSDKLQGEFLNELAEKTAKYIEDRHFEIGVGNKTFHGGEKAEPRSVGSNFFYSKNKPADYQSLGSGWSDEAGERFPTWEIGTLKQGNEDILIVSIPNLGFKNDYESWQDFIETFDNIYLPNKEKWDKGRIVLDVRGNRGGEDKPIDHVAKRLYGNMLNTYKRCEIKDTALSNYFLHKHGAYNPQNYERSGIKAEDLVVRNNFSGENRTLFDETDKYYPFNEQTGYNGRIDILLDRDVGSSAESAYTSFYHHKNVRYIGENTSGMQQYTQGTFPAPWGGSMRVAVTKLTYWDKEGENIEVKGHKPDINCSGHDAFDVALTIGIDDGRAIGFREKNEKESENKVYVEYDPKAPTDARKAYYAKYLDPAIAEIEKDNIAENQRLNANEFIVQFFQENFSYTPENLKSGENSVSFQYNGYRIRFPKKESSVQDYEKEAYISQYIAKKSPDLDVPIVEVKERNGKKFSVHKEIEGKTLIGKLPEDKDNIHFESLSQTERKKLAKDIGVFLAKLHNISLQDADSEIVKSKQMGIQAEEHPNFIEKNEVLYRDLGIEYRPIKMNKEDLVLSHNDFHGGNFILDEENNFKGAIDLGEAGINYRYKDFMSLYSSYGREFIRDVVSSYNENSATSISMEELDFHYLNKVADFAHYAAKPEYKEKSSQLQKIFDKCINDYRTDVNRVREKDELTKSRQKITEIYELSVLKKDFLNMPKESLPSYFSAQSSNPEFTNSQLYFNLFSKKYNLYEDGQFDRMCQDMKKSLGEDVYFQLMSNLHDLRDKKVEEIINNTGEFLTHTTNVPPEMMGGSVLPRNNLNQFGENRNNYVFATESESERDFYALRTVDKERKNINWKKQARVDGEEKNVFILEEINQESYTYFLPKEKFTPVVCLDGRFGHEWTATEEIPYSHHEKNNHEEIKKRNIVKLVDGTKFRGQNDTFREKLNNPDTIISTLDNSGVLVESKKEILSSKFAKLRAELGSAKEKEFQPRTINPNMSYYYQYKKQNG